MITDDEFSSLQLNCLFIQFCYVKGKQTALRIHWGFVSIKIRQNDNDDDKKMKKKIKIELRRQNKGYE